MIITNKALVTRSYNDSGSTVYELDDSTVWKFVDEPFKNAINKEVTVHKNGKKAYLQFKGSNQKFVVDEM